MNGDFLGHQPELTLGEKLWQINWKLILLLTAIAAFGWAMLYSAAERQRRSVGIATSGAIRRRAVRHGAGRTG